MGKEKDLLEAVRTKNVEQARKIVSKLKKTGASGTQAKKKNTIDIQDEHGFSILHHCALHGYADVLKDVIDLGGSVSLMDNKGMTPLHMAAFGGRYESCQVLLMRNADSNAGTRTGDTPLHIVSTHGYAKIAEVLINERANCNLQNVSGQTPLDLACENGNNEIVSLLLNTGQCVPKISGLQTPVHLAAKQGHVQCLRLLVGHGYSVNTNGANGTPLHEAALYGKTEAVKFLIEVGADVTIANSQGLTPLEVINRYTDPRSGHSLKLLLQGAVEHAAKMKQQQQQQQLRSETASQPLSRPPSSRSHHQDSPSDPHPPYPPNQPPPPSQPRPHHQPHPPQQQSLDQPPNWKPEEPRGYAIGGNPSLAAMIAAKAASRKPMVSSPTKKDNTDHQQLHSSAQAMGYSQHSTAVSAPQYYPPPTYTKQASHTSLSEHQQVTYSSEPTKYTSQQASHTSQPVQYTSQQASHTSQPVQYTSQQASHTSQPVQYTSQQANYVSQQASHTSQLPSQQASHTSQPERYASQHTSHSHPVQYASQQASHPTQPGGYTSHPERYASQQATQASHSERYASQHTIHGSHSERYTSQQTSHGSHPERYTSQQTSHGSHPERYTSQQTSHGSHPERYASQQTSHGSHPERYASQQTSHGSHPERYASQQTSHGSHPERHTSQQASHPERYTSQQASHGSHQERYASQPASHPERYGSHQATQASHLERYASQQASHGYQPAKSPTTLTAANIPTRSASVRYPNDSKEQANPTGYLPGSSYATEHINRRERSSSGGPQTIPDNDLSEDQSRTRSNTVHDTSASNANRPTKKPKPTPSIPAKDDDKLVTAQASRSVSVESTSSQPSAPTDTIQPIGPAVLRKSSKRPVPVPQKSAEPSEENELMQKLRRRQHKIEEVEAQITADQQEQISSANQPTEQPDQPTEPSKAPGDGKLVTVQHGESPSTQHTTSPSQYTTSTPQYTTNASQYTTHQSQYATSTSQYTTSTSQYTTSTSQYITTTSASQYTTSTSQYITTTSASQYTTSASRYTTSPSQYVTSKSQYTTSSSTSLSTATTQYTGNPAQYTANPAQYTVNPAQYNASSVSATTAVSAATVTNLNQHLTTPTPAISRPIDTLPTTVSSTVSTVESTAVSNIVSTTVSPAVSTTVSPAVSTTVSPAVSTTVSPAVSTVVSTSVNDNLAAIKRSPVLEKKLLSTSDVTQLKITRPSTPPSSAANTNLTAMDYASGLSMTSSLSSSSISSASTNPAAVAMTGGNVEAIPISEWLVKYKLSDYITIFQQAGFDNTDFIVGITAEELIDIGVTKIGHRKKIMTAVQTSQLKEPILAKKPVNVKEWLSVCGLVQYHQTLLDAGYDDIDFIADITRDELIEVGVSKYAHLKRLMKSIGQLLELTDSGTASASSPTPSSGSSTPVIQATSTNQNAPMGPGASTTNINQNVLPATPGDAVEDHVTNKNEEDISADKKEIIRQGAFAMDPAIASKKGPPIPTRAASTGLTEEQRRQQQQQRAMASGHPDGSNAVAKIPPKVAKKPKPNKTPAQPQASTEYLEDDIIAGLDKDKDDAELSGLTSDLDLALQGFGDEPTAGGSDDRLNSNKPEDDDLFGELDDMLADLNAQLNVIIPTSST